MQRSKKQIEDAFKAKGFYQDDTHHHVFIYVRMDGKKTNVRTRTSHSSKMKSIGDPLLGEMAKQCKLSRAEFIKLVDCPLSREDYERCIGEYF